MRKLDEQWVEELDGKKHMLKAVTPIINGHPDIKDLGILKDGLLPTPWDEKQYPQQEIYRGEWSYYAKGSGVTMRATGKTKQQAIDAWNRRA